MTLPTDNKARKALPLYGGTWGYFPDALAEMARVSQVGNEQHNPGQPLHWAREKSTDQMNTCQRHLVDRGSGVHKDTDGTYHLAKVMWRAAAQLQLDIEAERKAADATPEPEFSNFAEYPLRAPDRPLSGFTKDEGEPFSPINPCWNPTCEYCRSTVSRRYNPADLPIEVHAADHLWPHEITNGDREGS